MMLHQKQILLNIIAFVLGFGNNDYIGEQRTSFYCCFMLILKTCIHWDTPDKSKYTATYFTTKCSLSFKQQLWQYKTIFNEFYKMLLYQLKNHPPLFSNYILS